MQDTYQRCSPLVIGSASSSLHLGSDTVGLVTARPDNWEVGQHAGCAGNKSAWRGRDSKSMKALDDNNMQNMRNVLGPMWGACSISMS